MLNKEMLLAGKTKEYTNLFVPVNFITAGQRNCYGHSDNKGVFHPNPSQGYYVRELFTNSNFGGTVIKYYTESTVAGEQWGTQVLRPVRVTRLDTGATAEFGTTTTGDWNRSSTYLFSASDVDTIIELKVEFL